VRCERGESFEGSVRDSRSKEGSRLKEQGGL